MSSWPESSAHYRAPFLPAGAKRKRRPGSARRGFAWLVIAATTLTALGCLLWLAVAEFAGFLIVAGTFAGFALFVWAVDELESLR